MRMSRFCVLMVCAAVVLALADAGAQTKLAQTGMKFLGVGTDARPVALGEAFTAVEGGSTALFYNPASMARLEGVTSLGLGLTQWIADINQYYAGAAFSPWGGEYGVIGIEFQTVDYGTFEGTIVDPDPNGKGYFDEADIPGLNFKPGAYMIGIGYARALSDKFAIGGAVKYVSQNLGDTYAASSGETSSNKANVLAFDFGVLYRTGFKSLNFGMTVRNFAREVRYQQEGFQLPLTFKIGVSMNLFDLTELDRDTHGLLLAIDAEHPRDYPEQVRVGAEYLFMNILALRVGFVTPSDEYTMTYGVGIQPEVANLGFGLDYAYTPFGVFGDVHRFTFQFSL